MDRIFSLSWQAIVVSLLLLQAPSADARVETRSAYRDQVLISRLVTGTLELKPDGRVERVEISKEDLLGEGLAKFVRDTAKTWMFEPSENSGSSAYAPVAMSLRLVARKDDSKDYQVRIVAADFRSKGQEDPGSVGAIAVPPPKYPQAAVRKKAQGAVYLVLKIEPDGSVADVVAEQVNLRVIAGEREMEVMRQTLAAASIKTARSWKFKPPSGGVEAKKPFWSVRVPVTFTMGDKPANEMTQWVGYIPGPKTKAPWQASDDVKSFSPDALADGDFYMADRQGPRLLTPLDG